LNLEPQDAAKINSSPADKVEAAGSFVGELAQSAVYSGVQQPLKGLAQIVDVTMGADLLPRVEFMKAPAEAEFNSGRWYAQTIGNGFGALLPFLATRKVLFGSQARQEIAGQTGQVLQQSVSLAARQSAIGLSLKESAVVGFANDFVLHPVEGRGKEEVARSFWHSRLNSGVEGAVSFTTLTASSLSLNRVSMTPGLRQHIVGAAIRNPVISGVVSGVPGGVVGATFEAVRSGDLSVENYGKSIYSMMVAGGALGAKAELARLVKEHQSASSADGEKQPSKRLAKASDTPSTLTDHYNDSARKVNDFLERHYRSTLLTFGKPETKLELLFNGPKREERSLLFDSYLFEDCHGMRLGLAKEPSSHLKPLYEQALPASRALLEKLKSADSSTRPDGTLSEQEINAYQALRFKSPAEAEALAQILGNNRPANAWALKKVSSDFEIQDKKSATALNQESLRVVADTKLWQTMSSGGSGLTLAESRAIEKLVSERALTTSEEIMSHLQARGYEAQYVGRSIFESTRWEKSVEPLTERRYLEYSRRGQSIESALQTFEKVKGAGTVVGDVLTLEEAKSYGTLRNEGFYSESFELERLLRGRGPATEHVIRKISHDVEHQYYRDKVFDLTEEQFKGVFGSGERLKAARHVYEKVEAETPAEREFPHITVQEAQAIRSLDLDNFYRSSHGASESSRLVDLLARRGIEAELLAHKTASTSGADFSEARLRAYAEEVSPATRLLKKVAAGKADGIVTISLEDAQGLKILHGLGMKNRLQEVARFFDGESPESVIWLTGRLSRETQPLTQVRLEELIPDARLYGSSMRVLSDLRRTRLELEPADAPNSLKPEEVNAYLGLSKLGLKDEQDQLRLLLVRKNSGNDDVLWMFEREELPVSQVNIERAYLMPKLEPVLKAINETMPEDAKLESVIAIVRGGAIGAESLQGFAHVWKNVKLRSGVKTALEAEPDLVRQFSENPSLKSLPEEDIGPVFDHLQKTGANFGAKYDTSVLSAAAKVWQFEPTVPLELAEQFSGKGGKDCLRAADAWLQTGGDKTQFWNKYSDSQAVGLSTVVSRLTSADAAMPAIEILHRNLSPEARVGLGLAVSGAESPLAVVASIKSAHFEAAFKELREPSSLTPVKEIARSLDSQGGSSFRSRLTENSLQLLQKYFDPAARAGSSGLARVHAVLERVLPDSVITKLEQKTDSAAIENTGPAEITAPSAMNAEQVAKGAAGLALTFKGGSLQWLKTQRDLGRTDHDAVYWLPLRNAQDLQGLGPVLLSRAFRPASKHEMLSSRWSGLPDEVRSLGYDKAIEHIKQATYKQVKAPEFASEAAEWGVSPDRYSQYEQRFIASQSVPMPFPVNKTWSEGGLPVALFLAATPGACSLGSIRIPANIRLEPLLLPPGTDRRVPVPASSWLRTRTAKLWRNPGPGFQIRAA